ncbi:MAG: transporter [Lachnospiraceae bacterium]
MKESLFSISMLFFFIGMLFFPQKVFAGASDGLLLWFQIVLPTLLPFMILSNLLIHTDAITYIARFLGPLITTLFGTSKHGSFAVIVGFLCGYPMGAKVTADLLKEGRIHFSESRYLLSFCNNTSPIFILSYMLWQNLDRKDLLAPTLIILYGAPILTSFFFRRIYHIHGHSSQFFEQSRATPSSSRTGFALLDSCIMDGFSTITKVGGYIILFSILITLLKGLPFHSFFWNKIVLPSLEITNGIPFLCQHTHSFSLRYILVLSLTSFGGWCSIAQTKCMLNDTGISIIPYIAEKLLTTLVTSFFAIFYLFIY